MWDGIVSTSMRCTSNTCTKFCISRRIRRIIFLVELCTWLAFQDPQVFIPNLQNNQLQRMLAGCALGCVGFCDCMCTCIFCIKCDCMYVYMSPHTEVFTSI